MTAIAPTMQAFFTTHLLQQRQLSPHTVRAYSDTWRLLLTHLKDTTGIQPSQADFADLSADQISMFLQHLQDQRGNTTRTRNARLAAIHSFYGYAALRHPEHAADIARVLAIPAKRTDIRLVTWLTEEESTALLATPDPLTWTGQRDQTMMHVALQTGLRAAELTGLTRADVRLDAGPHLACTGKGRKERIVPLTPETVTLLRAWFARDQRPSDAPVFPSRNGTRLSHDALQQRIAIHAAACPKLAGKHVSPHTLRHSCAMRLLHAGIDITVIALWLGHEQIATTMRSYLHADLALKQTAIDRTTPLGVHPGPYQPNDQLMTFLTNL